MAKSSQSESMNELLPQIRTRDYDRYLAMLCAPRALQPSITALLAFNAEIASVAEVTQEPQIAAIRLVWWREAITEINAGDAPRDHPVVLALAEVLAIYPHWHASLLQMIETRFADTEMRKGFTDTPLFMTYLDGTAGTLHRLIAELENPLLSVHTALRSHARHYAIIGLLRALPHHVSEGIIRWPLDSLQHFGLNPAAIEAGEERERLRRFILYWLDCAEQEAATNQLPSSYPVLRRFNMIARLYATRLRKANGDISKLPARLPMLPLRLYFH